MTSRAATYRLDNRSSEEYHNFPYAVRLKEKGNETFGTPIGPYDLQIAELHNCIDARW